MSDNSVRKAVEAWGSAFQSALKSGDADELRILLADPSYYRDNGALTWDYRQFHGRDAVISTLLALAGRAHPSNFRLSEKWPAPSVLGEGGNAYVEAFFDFDTDYGTAVLVVNAVPADAAGGALKARSLYTRLEALNVLEDKPPFPRGRGYTPSFPGETWKQHRDAARQYTDHEPEVIVVGAGQAGLVTAAYMRRFGIDVLNVDRYEHVGDSWGRRYKSLTLHNPIEMNGFPFLDYPPHYPEYVSKDVLGEWLNLYATYMDLNVWTSTLFTGGTYDEAKGRWDVVLRLADGAERHLHPRHLVLATGGIGGKPYMPELPGLKSFAGKVLHSSQFTVPSDYNAKKAVVIGVATSAHDISRDLVSEGVDVTMFQRGPLVVTNVETANLAYAGYIDPTQSVELVDLRYGTALINPLREQASQAYHKMAKEMDRDILQRLEAAGLKLGDGVNGQGFLDLFLRTGGGYYLNTGTSELIADGKIKIEQFSRIVEFCPQGVKLENGDILEADIVILATGYEGRKSEVVDLFGPEVAEKVGEIARLDAEGEWANIWSQTGQRGLWFNGGGINQMRPGSERLALLIKADLAGLIPDDYRRLPRNSSDKPAYEVD